MVRCVSAHIYFVRSKVVTCCVMKWRRERFQANYGQVSHELRFSLCFNLSAEHASELYRLGQIMSSCDPKQFVVIFATVVATPACPIWWKCRVIRRDIQCSRGSVALCLVSQETKASSTRPPTLIIPFLSLNGRAVGDLLFFRRSWSVFCGFL